MFSYYGIKQNVIYSGKWGFATPRNGICSGKWSLANRRKPFARQNGASRIAGSHLPDKTGPRTSREDICSGKRGLALRREAFARQNESSRIAGRRLPDKTGLRDPAKRQAPAHFLYFAIRITGLSSSSRLEAISFNGPRSLPSFKASIKSAGSKPIWKGTSAVKAFT